MHIGKDVIIDETAKFTTNAVVISNHVSIDYGFYCTTQLRLHDYVHIGPHCSVIGGKNAEFHMSYFSSLSAGCRVICASDEHLGKGIPIPWVPSEFRDNVINKPIVIGKFASICTGVILFPGVLIPEGTVIGAGCIVRRNPDPWMVYVPGVGGNPEPVKERPKEKIIEYAKKLGF